jgi:hypothetical protein
VRHDAHIKVVCRLLFPFPFDNRLIRLPLVVCRICLFRRCRIRCLEPCVRVCVVIVRGANANLDRDFAVADEIYRLRCGVRVIRGPVVTIDAPHLLDLDQPTCPFPPKLNPTAEETELYNERGGCTNHDIIAYYVRSLSGGFRGCATYPANRPGFTVANSATKFTFAHELGHVLGLPHVNDTTNLMNGSGTAAITQDPPNLTAAQCDTIKSSPFITRC